MKSIMYWLMASGALAIFYVYTLASSWVGTWPSRRIGKEAPKDEDVAHNMKIRKGSIGLLIFALVVYGGLLYKAKY